MYKYHLKLSILLIAFILFITTNVIYSYEVDIKADSLTYKQDDNIINASGHVKLDWLGKIMQADNIEMKIVDKKISANGNVVIQEKTNTIYSDKISYDMEQESGEMENTTAATAETTSVFLQAEKMVKESSTTYKIYNVKISNCDLDNPHHYAYAKEGMFVVDKKVTIYKATYYVGGIPIFYFPKYTRTLEKGSDSKFSYEIEPGYTNDGGLSAKLKLKYQFTKEFDASLLYDYLGTSGNGIGTELNYYKPNEIKGTLFAYGAKYNDDDSQRWMIKPSYWQQIDDKWKIQAHGEFVSDSYFNNRYKLEDWDRVLNKRKSYLALTRQTNKSYLRLSSELNQTYNPITDKVQEGSFLNLPEATFSLYPIKTLGAYSNVEFNLENKTLYEYFYPETEKTYDSYKYIKSSVDYNITKDYKLSKRLTFKPKIGIREEYYSNTSPEDDNYEFITKYYGSLNARYRIAWWMDWNISYNAKLRTTANSLKIDSDAFDEGIETNDVRFSNYMYISSKFIIRNTTGYDLRNVDTSELGYEHWYPFITEITYIPSSMFTLYAKQQQGLNPCKFNSMQVDATVGQLERFYFNIGSYYYSTNADIVDFVAKLGFWLNAKWRFDYIMRTKYSIEKNRLDGGKDHEFRLYRDLHCFNLGTSFRLRDSYYEWYFKFEMKSNVPTFLKKDGTKEIDQEFYPWR